MATNLYAKPATSTNSYTDRMMKEAEERKKKAAMEKAAAASKAAKAKAAAAEDKKRTEFNSRKSGALPKFAAAKEVARTVRNELKADAAKAKAVRDKSNALARSESVAKFGSKINTSAAKPAARTAAPKTMPAKAEAKSTVSSRGQMFAAARARGDATFTGPDGAKFNTRIAGESAAEHKAFLANKKPASKKDEKGFQAIIDKNTGKK